jgi:hypothetical protein
MAVLSTLPPKWRGLVCSTQFLPLTDHARPAVAGPLTGAYLGSAKLAPDWFAIYTMARASSASVASPEPPLGGMAFLPFMEDASSAPVAQLDRVLPSEGRGRGFESRWARQLQKRANFLGILALFLFMNQLR